MTRPLVCAVLIGLMLAAAPLQAGNPYGYGGGCGYQTQYATPTYSSAPIYYPAGYYPPTTSYTQYQAYQPSYDFFRPGQDIISTRLAQEAATAAVDKFKAELSARDDAARRAAKEQEDSQFKAQVVQALAALNQQRTVPISAPPPVPATDPKVVQLEADNAQLKATLQRLIDAQRAAPSFPLPPGGSPMPAIPKVEAPPVPSPPPPVAVQPNGAGAQFQTALNSHCTKCHNGGKGEGQGHIDLRDATKLAIRDLALIDQRMKGEDGKPVMPPAGNTAMDAGEYFAFTSYLAKRAAAGN